MKDLIEVITISLNDKIFLKNPESSDLGKKIIKNSILLIEEIGFACFNFKKLGAKIGSNESSIYRYFENKHKLLLYLTSWYWGWVEYKLVFATTNVENPEIKLLKGIEVISSTVNEDSSFSHINEMILKKIVMREFSKSYLTKEVDKENKEGYFSIYKRLINRIKEMIIDANPDYPFPASLASTVVEGVMHQSFLKEHFTSITDCNETTTPNEFFTNLVFNALNLSIDVR